MMGQELFEHPKSQYPIYNVAVLDGLGDPESHLNGTASEAESAAMEEALDKYPDAAITFDEESGHWIVGAKADINRMFADRDAFVEALENNEDPGV
ncbi:molecular chaperone GrpE [Corynebacterium striatum]|nr:molecular chaperone GrpE [Corynebacterium striatum]